MPISAGSSPRAWAHRRFLRTRGGTGRPPGDRDCGRGARQDPCWDRGPDWRERAWSGLASDGQIPGLRRDGGPMSATDTQPANRQSELAGQTVVVLGGSAGIGLATARLAHELGAAVVVAARHEEPLRRVADELGARTSAFDATDPDRLKHFFAELDGPVDHLLLTGPGPYYAPLADFDFDAAARDLATHVL